MAMEAHVRASDHSLLREHGPVWLTAIGRLEPGVSIRQARDELDAIMKSYLKSQGDARVERWGVAVARSERVPAPLAGPVVGFIGMLGVLTALVLVIACSNVAGMLLARGIDRRHELATRVAVGASRARLVRQLLLEGAVLAAIAGACSIPLSYFLIRLLAGFQPSIPIPIALDLRVDPRVHAVTLALAACAALAFALLPALQTTRVDLTAALRAASATPDRRRTWLRQGLVVAQVTVALVLLVVAGLFLRSIYAAASIDVGFETRNVDTLKIDTHIGGYATDAQGVRVVEDLMEGFRAIPGVTAVGASRMVPLQDSGLGLGDLRAPGYAGPDGSGSIDADWDVVSADYFRTLQIPIVAGRPFGPQDREGAPFAAIVNRTMAERLWPGQDAIGRTLIQDMGRGATHTLLIVGVAQDAKYRFITESPRNFIYVPLAQQFMSEVTVYVRRTPGPSRAADLRRAVGGLDLMLPVIHTETLEQATSITTVPQRLAAWIAGIVGSLGLFLAALGLYGVTAFAVSQRRREIAIRIAVGASHRAVVWLVLRQAIVLAVVGAIAGIGIAGTVARLLRSFLIGLEPLDPLTFGLAAVLLGCVMVTAAWTPARRAGMANPVQWLRAE
jgi:predicted permease